MDDGANGLNPIRPFVADPESENAPIEDENSRIMNVMHAEGNSKPNT